MYEGLLNSEYENIIFRTMSETPIECTFENFRGIEREINRRKEKPTIGLWGSFKFDYGMPMNIDKNESYPWENFSQWEGVRNYDKGMFGLDYKLPKDCNILVFDIEKDLDYLLKKYGDWKTIGSNFDAIIQTSSEWPYDVPSVCITNKETFKNLQVENYFYRDNFESERIFITKDLINNALDNLDNCGYLLKYLDDNLKNDINICKRAINQNGYSISFIGDKLKDNKELALLAIEKEYRAYDFLNNILKEDIDICKFVAGKNYRYLQKMTNEIKDNRDIVLNTLKHDGYAFEFISDRLKNDKEIILTAIKQTSWIYDLIPEEFKKDKDIILETIKKDGKILDLEQFPIELRSDRDFFLKVIKDNSCSLQYASDELKNDEELVIKATNKNFLALQYVSDNFKNNKDFIKNICKKNLRALDFASDELKNDKDFILELLNFKGCLFKYINNHLLNDMDIISKALKQNIENLYYITDFSIKNDKNIIINHLKTMNNPLNFARDISKSYYLDKNIVYKKFLYNTLLDYLENTNFSLEYNIEELRTLEVNKFEDFIFDRISDNYNVKLLEKEFENVFN